MKMQRRNLGLRYASSFSQMFRTATGQSAHQFVLAARIERAKELLKGSQRVIDVALSCGFQTQQHFSRVFRALCNLSPTEYRRREGIADGTGVKGGAIDRDRFKAGLSTELVQRRHRFAGPPR